MALFTRFISSLPLLSFLGFSSIPRALTTLGPDEYEEMEEEAEEEEEENDDDSADMDESDESDEDENESDEGEGEERRRRVFDVPIRRRRCSRLF